MFNSKTIKICCCLIIYIQCNPVSSNVPNNILRNPPLFSLASFYRIQAYDSIMCGSFCIGFINIMFNGNSLTDYTSLFSPNDLK